MFTMRSRRGYRGLQVGAVGSTDLLEVADLGVESGAERDAELCESVREEEGHSQAVDRFGHLSPRRIEGEPVVGGFEALPAIGGDFARRREAGHLLARSESDGHIPTVVIARDRESHRTVTVWQSA